MENLFHIYIWQATHSEEKTIIFFKIRFQKAFSQLNFFLVLTELSVLTEGFKTGHSSLELSFNIKDNFKDS